MRTGFKYPCLETERMYLKPLTQNDVVDVFNHFSDPFVTEFMDIEPCKSMDEAKEIIEFHVVDQGCRWGLFYKSTDQFIGTCGYHCLDLYDVRKAEIGFDLIIQDWGKGLMKEAVLSLLVFGFQDMN
ncbi:GNAT family N-acetyltransferase [Paenibacillus wynnii]|uniref:GNAT family N-acetyltransferase n=1 Tax=Paenibacillus wynnii TaxID=268407 RepID=UPI001F0A8C73|nr:GNAT family N-acetyltransferase [Paenibacillus wynnii]